MSKRMGLSMIAELNPLAQHFAGQVSKIGASSTSKGAIQSVMSKSLSRDVGGFSAYFQHGAFMHEGRWMTPNSTALTERVMGTRKLAGTVGGTWAGLNVLDQNSKVTRSANYLATTAAMGAAAYKLGPMAWKYGNKIGGAKGAAIKGATMILGAVAGANRLGMV